MRTILYIEKRKERCNAAALGITNAAVALEGIAKPSFEDFIMKEQQNEIDDLEFNIRQKERQLEKLINTNVTKYQNEVNKSFVNGKVGFMGGKSAKKWESDRNKFTEHSQKVVKLDNEIRDMTAKLRSLKNPREMSYKKAKGYIIELDKVISSKIFQGRKITTSETKNLRTERKRVLNIISKTEKKYLSNYQKL